MTQEEIDDICFRLKDYDRLSYDYSVVLCHATCSTMSYSNYDVTTACSVIDQEQAKHYYSFVKDDVNMILKDGGTLEDIMEYINGLTDGL